MIVRKISHPYECSVKLVIFVIVPFEKKKKNKTIKFEKNKQTIQGNRIIINNYIKLVYHNHCNT